MTFPRSEFPLKELFGEITEAITKDEATETFRHVPPTDLDGRFALEDGPLEAPALKEHLLELLKYIPSTSRKDFCSQLFAGREESALLGDMLASFINTSMSTYKIAGVLVHLERTIINELCRLCGFSGGGGSFFPGGSLSNFCALLAARSRHFPNARENGVMGLSPVIYASEESHYSNIKNANIAGFGRNSVRLVPSDEQGKMSAALLDKFIAEDKHLGKQPFFVCATAGTTVLGAYDDIDGIAAVTKKNGLWLHIDGAFGGSALFSPKHRPLLSGSGKADSMTIDVHKMMGIPLICSMALFRDNSTLQDALSEKADYLFQTDQQYNPGHAHIQCGRHNDVLKLWSFWRYYGHSGLAKRVETQFANARAFSSMIEDHPDFKLLMTPESLNVCFNHTTLKAEDITQALDEQGLSKVGYGAFKGKNYIRAVFVNPRLTKEDLTNYLERIVKACKSIQ